MRFESLPIVLFAILSPTSLLSASVSAAARLNAPAHGSCQQQESWPAWRGADGLGLATGSPPTEWSEDKNVKWKTAIPGLGLSTPITWGDRIYVTTAVKGVNADDSKGKWNAYDFRVLCLDRGDGKILWSTSVNNAVPHAKVHPTNSQASNSPVTDGERIYAHFGSRGLFCLDMAGKELWSKDFGEMKRDHEFGGGASPVLTDKALLIIWDHDGDSFFYALDKKSGRQLWKQPRDEGATWATPALTKVGRKTLAIVPASGKSRAYDVKNGKVVWEVSGLTSNVIPSPVVVDGIVYLMSGYQGTALQAIKLKGAKGDLKGSKNVLWTHNRQTPYVPSSLVYEGSIYFLRNTQSVLSCLDAKTGEVHYDGQRLRGLRDVYASPIGAGGHVYFASRDGKVKVIKAGDEYEAVATNELDDGFDASPIVIGDELYLRGRRSLYCISDLD